jgi:hypothetical protein
VSALRAKTQGGVVRVCLCVCVCVCVERESERERGREREREEEEEVCEHVPASHAEIGGGSLDLQK